MVSRRHSTALRVLGFSFLSAIIFLERQATLAGPGVTAACCTGDQCTDGLTQQQCEGQGGFFLAPPYPAVADCSGDPCSTGSCCTGPGACSDTFVGNPFTKPDCDAIQGLYYGGVRCQGGTCASTPVESCATNEDCPHADCAGDPSALNQPLPCPLCEIEGANNCQPFEEVSEFALSDRSVGVVAADDFTPLGTVLNQVCVWGFYRDIDPAAPSADCGPIVVSDHFRVRVYANDKFTGRAPRGGLVGESMTTSVRGILPSPVLGLESEVYGYQLTLDTAITLTPGSVYWLEVSNDVTDSLQTCLWHWMGKTPNSSSLSFVGRDDHYFYTYEVAAEQAFCLNFEITPSTIGSLEGPCCLCDDGDCSLRSLYDCDADNGLWDITRTSCDGVTCAMVQPNDQCVDGPSMITSGVHVANNRCATTDGYGPIPSDTGGSQIESDLWYYYVSEGGCNAVISECGTGPDFNPMLAVYTHCGEDPAGCDPTVCPPCPLNFITSDAALAGIGQDDSCTGADLGGAGVWISQDQLGRNALADECFLIRVGSYPGGGRGLGTLDVSCIGCRDCGLTPPVVADTVNKTRFVSFTIPNDGLCTANATPFPCCTGPGLGSCTMPGETAIRIVFSELHVVSPPYTGGPSLPFTAFFGQYVYVGPPAQYFEHSSGTGPFMASFTTCTPHFQDWSTVGLLHVTGPHIVPSSVYQVEQLAASCNGNIGSASCQPGGSLVSSPTEIVTTRWGDVAELYNPPSLTVQPDASDISAMVNKFRNTPGSAEKVRELLAGIPGNPWGLVDQVVLSVDFGFAHVSACVDAFRGMPYPYRMGKCTGSPAPPATGACATHSDCSGPNGLGPCILYCP